MFLKEDDKYCIKKKNDKRTKNKEKKEKIQMNKSRKDLYKDMKEYINIKRKERKR